MKKGLRSLILPTIFLAEAFLPNLSNAQSVNSEYALAKASADSTKVESPTTDNFFKNLSEGKFNWSANDTTTNSRTIAGRRNLLKKFQDKINQKNLSKTNSTNEGRNYIFSTDEDLSTAGDGILLKRYVPLEASVDTTINLNDMFYSNSGDLKFSFTSTKKVLDDVLKRSAPNNSGVAKAFRKQIRDFLGNQTPSDSTSVVKLNKAVQDGILNPDSDDLSDIVPGKYGFNVSNKTESFPAIMHINSPSSKLETAVIDSVVTTQPDSTNVSQGPIYEAQEDSTAVNNSNPNNSKWYSFFGMDSDLENETNGEVSAGRKLGEGWNLGSFFRLNLRNGTEIESSNTLPVHHELIGPGTYETRTTNQSLSKKMKNVYSFGVEASKDLSDRFAGYVKAGFVAKKMTKEVTSTDNVTITRNGQVLDSYLLDSIIDTDKEKTYLPMVEAGIEFDAESCVFSVGAKNYDGETSLTVGTGVGF
jgi:hypothetical protein